MSHQVLVSVFDEPMNYHSRTLLALRRYLHPSAVEESESHGLADIGESVAYNQHHTAPSDPLLATASESNPVAGNTRQMGQAPPSNSQGPALLPGDLLRYNLRSGLPLFVQPFRGDGELSRLIPVNPDPNVTPPVPTIWLIPPTGAPCPAAFDSYSEDESEDSSSITVATIQRNPDGCYSAFVGRHHDHDHDSDHHDTETWHELASPMGWHHHHDTGSRGHHGHHGDDESDFWHHEDSHWSSLLDSAESSPPSSQDWLLQDDHDDDPERLSPMTAFNLIPQWTPGPQLERVTDAQQASQPRTGGLEGRLRSIRRVVSTPSLSGLGGSFFHQGIGAGTSDSSSRGNPERGDTTSAWGSAAIDATRKAVGRIVAAVVPRRFSKFRKKQVPAVKNHRTPDGQWAIDPDAAHSHPAVLSQYLPLRTQDNTAVQPALGVMGIGRSELLEEPQSRSAASDQITSSSGEKGLHLREFCGREKHVFGLQWAIIVSPCRRCGYVQVRKSTRY
ncbi:hypothetical protein FA15DRAFT_759015 [Coprinopsis marcescibilis]|uniref:Uncharacterized protein n=1 Tax=Coprinopsis marcescibilis TaxID=230819 RepID=A0A5C3KKZ7_COPMA|nr:hypothetical protein FA15DRAFT_759015 [Coprinopsis marcescibilis]